MRANITAESQPLEYWVQVSLEINTLKAVRLSVIRVILLLIVGGIAVQAQSLDGVWRSQGYGYVFEIQGPTLRAFEVTTTTCVAGFAAKRSLVPVPDREATFRSRDGTYFVKAGGTHDHKLLNIGSLSDIRIDRVAEIPAVCDPPAANTPIGNFEVFSRTFAEEYISFDLKGIDWDKVVADNRSKVTPRTTPSQLFDIFVGMIKPLADIHTGIEAPKLNREFDAPFRPGTDRLIKAGVDRFANEGRRALFAVTDRAYLQGPLKKFCRGHIQFGHINSNTGYLRILSFGGYVRHGDDSAALRRRWIKSFPIARYRR